MHEKERLLYRVERMVERKRRNEGEGVSEGLGWYMLLLLQPRAKKRAVEKKNNNVGLFFSFWFFLLICILLQSWFQFNEMCVCVCVSLNYVKFMCTAKLFFFFEPDWIKFSYSSSNTKHKWADNQRNRKKKEKERRLLLIIIKS